ncbi:DUF937 domain-containing protein [Streptomyces sp. NBC_01619]|uniref:DUF937 domain-containing protein n=1 Tax=Streptomyces pratisoli TaxID=3139917 RepID=A0ACC6QFX7_9ACTN|nr:MULTISPECIES: DUF937 domain-containing protein [unclassified Streptomyces]MCX4508962.1 DUF937 domain-containing protein [Streptomyces sp. NBC_01619]
MSDDSFQREVLNELGDGGLQEIADALGTDATGAQDAVGTSVSALSGGLREAAAEPAQADEVREAVGDISEPPLEGVVTLGGGLGGGLMAGVLAKLARPAAAALAKRTGMPVATVSRVFEVVIPVVVTVLAQRAARRRSAGAAPGSPGSHGTPGPSTGSVGDVLGDLLGGGPRKP